MYKHISTPQLVQRTIQKLSSHISKQAAVITQQHQYLIDQQREISDLKRLLTLANMSRLEFNLDQAKKNAVRLETWLYGHQVPDFDRAIPPQSKSPSTKRSQSHRTQCHQSPNLRRRLAEHLSHTQHRIDAAKIRPPRRLKPMTERPQINLT